MLSTSEFNSPCARGARDSWCAREEASLLVSWPPYDARRAAFDCLPSEDRRPWEAPDRQAEPLRAALLFLLWSDLVATDDSDCFLSMPLKYWSETPLYPNLL